MSYWQGSQCNVWSDSGPIKIIQGTDSNLVYMWVSVISNFRYISRSLYTINNTKNPSNHFTAFFSGEILKAQKRKKNAGKVQHTHPETSSPFLFFAKYFYGHQSKCLWWHLLISRMSWIFDIPRGAAHHPRSNSDYRLWARERIFGINPDSFHQESPDFHSSYFKTKMFLTGGCRSFF